MISKAVKIIVVLWSVVMFVATLILIREYSFVAEQSTKIVALKAEYENHLMTVSRIIHEYNTGKDKSDDVDTPSVEHEKKNDVFDECTSVKIYRPHNTAHRVANTNECTPKDDFIVVNRRLDYIKQSSIDYLQKQKLDSVVNPHEWQAYTELQRPPTAKKKRTIPRKKRIIRTKRTTRYKRKTVYDSSDIELSWPLDRSQLWLSSFYGPRKSKHGKRDFHFGVDMAACKGTPVYAAAPGVVIEARQEHESNGYGNTVVIAHSHKYQTRYAHLDTIKVGRGQHVARSTLIGTVGDTGNVRSRGKDASHLHFEVHIYGQRVDPLAFLS